MTNTTQTPAVAVGKTVKATFDETLARTEKALGDEGFGILTRIDVRATLKQKLDVDFPPYQILGACRPPQAHKALTMVPEIGVLMPCSVVVRQIDEGTTRVDAMNAALMAGMFPEADLSEVADEIAERINRTLAAI